MSTTEPRRLLPWSALRAWPRHLLLALLCLTMTLPFVWMVLTALKPLGEVESESWLPVEWRPGNFAEVFAVVPFARFYINTLFVASWVTFLQVSTSALAAYSFACVPWRGRDRLFLLYLATIMLPGLVMLIPVYRLMIALGWIDTYYGLIVPAAFTPMGTFLLRQFMLGIHPSLLEAAEIDGAGHWRTFTQVVLPLTRPGLVTLAVFVFMGNCASFLWPLVMLKSTDKYTLPVGLLFFDSSVGRQTHLLMAAVTMAVVPLIAVFVLAQRHLVRGIQMGAVKG